MQEYRKPGIHKIELSGGIKLRRKVLLSVTLSRSDLSSKRTAKVLADRKWNRYWTTSMNHSPSQLDLRLTGLVIGVGSVSEMAEEVGKEECCIVMQACMPCSELLKGHIRRCFDCTCKWAHTWHGRRNHESQTPISADPDK